MTSQIKNLLNELGISPENPFGKIILYLALIFAAILIILILLIFMATSARSRYNLGMIFVAVGVLGQIPILVLILYSRKVVRIRKIIAGDYWVHWQGEKHSKIREVYINGDGIYYPDQGNTVNSFANGLKKVEILPDSKLHFDFLEVRENSATSAIKEDKSITVYFPKDKEEEAKSLVERLQNRIGEPTNFLKDDYRIAWIGGFIILALSVVLFIPLIYLDSAYRAEIKSQRESKEQAEEVEQIVKLTPILQPIRNVIAPQIERLKTLPDGKMTAKEAGFNENAGVEKVLYGHCQPNNDFYVFVVMKTDVLKRTYLSGNLGTFNYTTKTSNDYSYCAPPKAVASVPIQLSDGWYYGSLSYLK